MSDLPQPHLYVRIPQELADRTKAVLKDNGWDEDDQQFELVLNRYVVCIEEAERIEADRKELEQYSKPLVPLDVPEEVWKAASANYVSAQWAPAPNHHPEYRDVRAAFRATIEWLKALEQSYGHPLNLSMVVPPTDPQG